MLLRILLQLALAFSLSQVIVADHVHDIHTSAPHGPAQPCGGRYQRESHMPTAGMAEPVVVMDTDQWITIYNETFQNTTCDDAKIAVNQGTDLKDSVTAGMGVEISGSATFLTNALFTKMKVEVGAKVEFTGERTVEQVIHHLVIVDTILRPCSAKSVMKQVHHRSVHGTIVGSDCKTICKCNGCSATQTTYCNKIEVSGNATGYEDGLTNIASATKPTVCDACTIPMPTVPNPSINNVTIVFPPVFPMPLAPVPDPISGNPPLIPMPMAPMPELFPGNPQLPPVTGNP